MKRILHDCLIVILTGLPVALAAQHPELSEVVFTDTVENGSFEGAQYIPAPGPKPMPPPPWIWCRWGPNTPDLQPGYWEVTVPPFDGNTYAGMISKVADENRVYHENFAIPLKFNENQDQFLIMHLANNLVQNNGDSSEGGRLRLILRQFSYCLHEEDPVSDTIWNSGLIKGEEWQPQFINFTSPIEEGFLVFEHQPAVDSANYINFSNLQIDGVSGPFPGFFAPPDIGPDTVICAGDSLTRRLPNVGPFVQVEWNDGDSTTEKVFYEQGEYHVTVSFREHSFSDTFSLFVIDPYPLELGEDAFVCTQSNLEFGPDVSHYEWVWDDGWLGSPRPLLQSGSYVIKGTNGACFVEDSVTYILQDCEVALEMPNVFSPNGDGINDVFRPMDAENLAAFQLKVYDRWGRMVFESRNMTDGWNGKNPDHEQLPEGVYFWSINFLSRYETTPYSRRGYVTLMR